MLRPTRGWVPFAISSRGSVGMRHLQYREDSRTKAILLSHISASRKHPGSSSFSCQRCGGHRDQLSASLCTATKRNKTLPSTETCAGLLPGGRLEVVTIDRSGSPTPAALLLIFQWLAYEKRGFAVEAEIRSYFTSRSANRSSASLQRVELFPPPQSCGGYPLQLPLLRATSSLVDSSSGGNYKMLRGNVHQL